MDLSITVYGIHLSYHFSCAHFLSRLDIDSLELAVESKVISMTDEHTLVISRHDEYLLHNPLEHSLDISPLAHCDVDTIVWREFQILEHRMELPAETSHDRTIHRPWKLAFIL